MRNLLADIISDTHDFRVVGEARTGYEVIRLVHELSPDVVTLDLLMPDLGGLEALGYIMSESPRAVIVVTGQADSMAQPALTALEYGALEVVTKPAGDEAREVDVLRRRLIDALRAAKAASIGRIRPSGRLNGIRERAPAAKTTNARCAIAIGASTGGPRALTDIIPKLPAAIPAAVLVVQHMPPTFTRLFAERLNGLSEVTVKEGSEGDMLRAGCVYVAPGGVHMSLKRAPDGVTITLDDSDPLWGVRPAADVLFNAVALHFGPASGGVVLTGMGRDGADGMRAIRDVGGWTAVQDEASSVVYGMPKASAPYAHEELPIDDVAEAVAARSHFIARRRSR
jgi:two-component system chemotaxis response regulator CheB